MARVGPPDRETQRAAMLAQLGSTPLPMFDSSGAVTPKLMVMPPQVDVPQNSDMNAPVTLGVLQQMNRSLLEEFSNKLSLSINAQFQSGDKCMDEMADKLNLYNAILHDVVSQGHTAPPQSNIPQERVLTCAQKQDKAMTNHVLLVDGVKKIEGRPVEDAILAFLREYWKRPDGTDFRNK